MDSQLQIQKQKLFSKHFSLHSFITDSKKIIHLYLIVNLILFCVLNYSGLSRIVLRQRVLPSFRLRFDVRYSFESTQNVTFSHLLLFAVESLPLPTTLKDSKRGLFCWVDSHALSYDNGFSPPSACASMYGILLSPRKT